jgi:ribosomal protein S27AE
MKPLGLNFCPNCGSPMADRFVFGRTRRACSQCGFVFFREPKLAVGALVETGVYKDPYFGMNLRSIPGTTYPIGERFSLLPTPADSPFKPAWWFRTEFTIPAAKAGRRFALHFDGINYRANIWLNGKKVADSIVHWKSLGSAVKDFFTSLAESTLRIVMERLFKPLQSSIEKVIDSLFEKLFNPGSKKSSASNLAPESVWGLLGTAGSGLPDWLKARRPRLKRGRAFRASSRRETHISAPRANPLSPGKSHPFLRGRFPGPRCPKGKSAAPSPGSR